MIHSEIVICWFSYFNFQNAMKRMRLVDDRIVYALNTSVPTQSFTDKVDAAQTCRSLHEQVRSDIAHY